MSNVSSHIQLLQPLFYTCHPGGSLPGTDFQPDFTNITTVKQVSSLGGYLLRVYRDILYHHEKGSDSLCLPPHSTILIPCLPPVGQWSGIHLPDFQNCIQSPQYPLAFPHFIPSQVLWKDRMNKQLFKNHPCQTHKNFTSIGLSSYYWPFSGYVLSPSNFFSCWHVSSCTDDQFWPSWPVLSPEPSPLPDHLFTCLLSSLLSPMELYWPLRTMAILQLLSFPNQHWWSGSSWPSGSTSLTSFPKVASLLQGNSFNPHSY